MTPFEHGVIDAVLFAAGVGCGWKLAIMGVTRGLIEDKDLCLQIAAKAKKKVLK